MGEAFREGQRLGEASGATKEEVLKTLTERHPDADEIRIRSAAAVDRDTEQTRPNDRLMRFFTYQHLPPHLAVVSAPFCHLAEHVCATLPSNPERTVALRKLLEAKDCAVRALLDT